MRKESQTSDFKKAKNTALRFLQLRNRSEREIRNKLKEKKFSDGVIKSTVEYLKEYNFIDDQLFARQWIAYRLSKPLGVHRIKIELKDKGISKDILEEELNKALNDYDEFSAAKTLVLKRAKKYTGLDIEKIKQRVYGYLTRKGFSSDSIIKALKEI